MSFPQLVKPKDLPPRKPRRLAWLDGYSFGVLTGVVIINVLAIPVLAFVRPFPGIGWLRLAQLGLAASWMTWSSGSLTLRYAAPILAIVLCGCSAHSLLAWENETLRMFLSSHLRVVPAVHLLLFPTRWLGWRWQFQDQVGANSDNSHANQFRLIHLLILLAVWSAVLGYLRWENGDELFSSIAVEARSILFAIMVVPVAWLVIANNRSWWLVAVFGIPLFIAAWNQLPQSNAHLLLDLEFEPFAVIAVWTLINMGMLYLFGLRGRMSREVVVEPKPVVLHV